MKTRKNRPLPEFERAIGQRLREFRKHHLLPLTTMAQAAGCGASLYGAMEAARTPMRMRIFLALYERFSISARWLFTGEGSVEEDLFLFEKVRAGVDPQEKFSAFYQRAIAPLYSGHHEHADVQRAGAVAALKRFIREAETGQMCSTAIVTVAQVAVIHWTRRPGRPFPPNLAFDREELYAPALAEDSGAGAATV